MKLKAVDYWVIGYSLFTSAVALTEGRRTEILDAIGKKIVAVCTQQPEPIQRHRSDVPKPLAAVLERMMAKDPDARFSTPAQVVDTGESSLFYYSYVTLTSLGLGDISPVTEAARALTVVEALMGQIYLVVLVARLVAMHIARRQAESAAEETEKLRDEIRQALEGR